MRYLALVLMLVLSSSIAFAQATFDPARFMVQDSIGIEYHKTGIRSCYPQHDPLYVAVADVWCGGLLRGETIAQGFSKTYRDPRVSNGFITLKGPDGPSEWYRVVPDGNQQNTVAIVKEEMSWDHSGVYRRFFTPDGRLPEFLGNGSAPTTPTRFRLVYDDCDPFSSSLVYDVAEYHEVQGPFDISTLSGLVEMLMKWSWWTDDSPLDVPPQWTTELLWPLGFTGSVWVVTLRSFWDDFSIQLMEQSIVGLNPPDASFAYRYEEQYDYMCVGESPFSCRGVGLVGWRVMYRPLPDAAQRIVTSLFFTQTIYEDTPSVAFELCVDEDLPGDVFVKRHKRPRR